MSGITKQIMPGPSGGLEEWQTLEVNVTLGFASGDIDLLGLPFLKVTLEPRHYLYNTTLRSTYYYVILYYIILYYTTWRAVSVAMGKNIHTDNVPIDLTCDSMNNYLSNIGCELNAQFKNTSATWKGPFDVITSESVMKHLLCLPNRSNNDILEFDSKLLKLSAHVIYPYLTCLFNLICLCNKS